MITLGLSMIFLMPNLYLKVGPADHGAAGDGDPVLGAARQADPRPDDDPGAFRIVSILLVIASVLYIVPQVYGLEAADQEYLGTCRASLISSENLALARPILWLSIALFGSRARVCSPGSSSCSAGPRIPPRGPPSRTRRSADHADLRSRFRRARFGTGPAPGRGQAPGSCSAGPFGAAPPCRASRSWSRNNSPANGRNQGRPSYGAGTSGNDSFDERRRRTAAQPLPDRASRAPS